MHAIVSPICNMSLSIHSFTNSMFDREQDVDFKVVKSGAMTNSAIAPISVCIGGKEEDSCVVRV